MMNLLGAFMGGSQKNSDGGGGNSILWILVIGLLLVYSNATSFLGLESLFGMNNNNCNQPCDDGRGSKRHYRNGAYCEPARQPSFLGPFGNFIGPFNSFFGGNGIFIVGVLAILFLCGDDDFDPGMNEACGTSIIEVE